MNRRPDSYLSGGAEVYLGVECAYLPAQCSPALQVRPHYGGRADASGLERRLAGRLRAFHVAVLCLAAGLLSAIPYVTPYLARLAN